MGMPLGKTGLEARRLADRVSKNGYAALPKGRGLNHVAAVRNRIGLDNTTSIRHDGRYIVATTSFMDRLIAGKLS